MWKCKACTIAHQTEYNNSAKGKAVKKKATFKYDHSPAHTLNDGPIKWAISTGCPHILIHLSVREEQLARELVRGRVVRVLGIVRADLSHPRFVPRGLVHPVVVTAGRAHCDFVDVAVVEDRPSGVIAYEYMTPRIA